MQTKVDTNVNSGWFTFSRNCAKSGGMKTRTLAEKFTSLRKARGLTQADPAEAVKVSRQAVFAPHF